MSETGYEFKYRDHMIRVTSPAQRSVWEAVIKKDPDVLVSQTPEWLDCICATGNYEDASRLYEISGRGAFVLPMVRSKVFPAFASTFYSPPNAWGMGGLIGDVHVQPEDVEIVVKDLLGQPGLRKIIRPNPLSYAVWSNIQGRGITAIPRKAHVLDLQGGFDYVWSKKFDTNTRRNVRKAESSGLTIECDQTGRLVPIFYQLMELSVDRWADHQHEPHWLAHLRFHQRDSIKKFEMIAKNIKSACRIWVAWHHNEPVAAILVLQGTNVNYTRGAMNLKLAAPIRANDLLHRCAIEDACQCGCRFYHMGETGQSDSLAHFKGRLGAEAVPYAEYHLEKLPITHINTKLKDFVKRLLKFKDA
jgi:hypothetical protein